VIPRSLVWLMLLQGPDRVLLPDPPGSFSAPLILGVAEDWRSNSFGVSHNTNKSFLPAFLIVDSNAARKEKRGF
jgi:hypothetical protein